MAKVVVAKLNSKAKPAAKLGVTEKRVRDAEGQLKTVRTVDVHSSTFGEDFRYVFEKNVAKARRENKRLFGTSDVALRKR